MIYDHISNKDRYKGMPQLYEGLCWLAEITEENFHYERVTLDGKLKFVVPKTYETKPEDEAKFENHRTQADIHYMVKGCEGIKVEDISKMELVGEFSEERDWGEYKGDVDGITWIKDGYFVAVLPGEAHKTGIMFGESKPILKSVFKYVVK